MAEQDLDRNEAATPYKLEKARERGQVSKSPEVVSAVVFTAAMVYLAWKGWDAWAEQFRFDRALLVAAVRIEPTPSALGGLAAETLRHHAALAAPYFLTLVVAALAANVLQTGPVFSFDPVKLDWNRINPARGLRQLFSMRTLVNGVRSVLKLALFSWVVWLALRSLAPDFQLLAQLPPAGVVRRLLADVASLGLKLALMLCLVAAADALYTRREFAKQMRMSRRELKDEHKHREGDPAIRARLRELRRELLKRVRALEKTREADVLVTNPTHFAVALRYRHGEMQAPQLVAKGAGALAFVMRRIAARHRIPVVENPSLARRLFRTLPIEAHVPPELYGQVARIIVWVFAMRDRAAAERAGREREVAWTP